jgi:hypothetical protein
MNEVTLQTNDEIYADITEQVIDTANTAISFYFNRPTRQSLVYVEDTLFDLVPFARITTKSRLGQMLVSELKQRLNTIQTGGVVKTLDRFDFLAIFPTEQY